MKSITDHDRLMFLRRLVRERYAFDEFTASLVADLLQSERPLDESQRQAVDELRERVGK
jgi:hypothetical protein